LFASGGILFTDKKVRRYQLFRSEFCGKKKDTCDQSFYGCTVHKERSEKISFVWIQSFAGKRRRGYNCEQ